MTITYQLAPPAVVVTISPEDAAAMREVALDAIRAVIERAHALHEKVDRDGKG